MDLWEVTGGKCFLSAGDERPAAGMHVQVSESDLRLWPDGVQEGSLPALETVAMLHSCESTRTAACCKRCFGRRRRSIRGNGDSGLVSVPYADLLGAVVDDTRGIIRLVHCPLRKLGNPESGREWKDIELQVEAQDPELWSSVKAWATKVNEHCLAWIGPRRFLVFINPASGRGRALQIWADVRSLWATLPWLSFDEVTTSYAGEASDRSQDPDILNYNGLVIVSGDGLVHEVLNGLALRPDAEQALRVPVSHIPAGSGNGLAKSALASCGEGYGPMEAAFAIAKGYQSRLHLMQVQQQGRPARVSFLSLSGAIVSDIDIESERLRCIGGARFTVWALFRAAWPRLLHAELIYWPASAAGLPPAEAPDISNPLTEETWVRDEDDFLFFWGMNVPWSAYDACAAPGVPMHEAVWHLLVVRRSAPRHALVRCLLSLESGVHVNQEHVEVIQCRAFRLVPRASPRGGILSLDGERVPFAPIQVWPSLHSTEVMGARPVGAHLPEEGSRV